MSTHEQVKRERKILLNNIKKDLFTVGQVCNVCGISRSTVLRMESKGLLTPAYCDGETGYRYYDNHNINKILQINAFLEMGLQYDDILEFYSSGGNSSGILQKLERRSELLNRTVSEMRLWNNDKKHLSCELIKVPDYVCFAREFTGRSFDDEYRDMYALCTEAFKKGYRMLATEPMFVINKNDDYSIIGLGNKESVYECCIPLEPDCASEETTVIPGGKALSILCYGDYKTITAPVSALLTEKMKELGLKPAGYLRGLCLVAPYMGKEIDPDKFVTRYVLPVKE